ncbi:hypothetical protein BCR39DRAFT_541941 [Naematelia encephala]|uniref:Uncharacterized protein n=1 Tax=Naematelia encephala TaxID=71784 RepID=A0A1Y2AUA7_9TREE|nr:hypothetical protein BCR39DRAFT_541941 [Naematelia encephala]
MKQVQTSMSFQLNRDTASDRRSLPIYIEADRPTGLCLADFRTPKGEYKRYKGSVLIISLPTAVHIINIAKLVVWRQHVITQLLLFCSPHTPLIERPSIIMRTGGALRLLPTE